MTASPRTATLIKSRTMDEPSDEPELGAIDPPALPDWADLVQRIHHSDPVAMEQLYAFFGKGVRYFIRRALGPEDLDDRVHDCFVTVIQAIQAGDLREPARLMGYIRTVVRRYIAGNIQEMVTRRRTETDYTDSLFSVADWKANPEQSVVSLQREAIGKKVLREISDRDREVLMRFYVHEQDMETICNEMGLTYNQYRLLKSRAKARFGKLGKRLADSFFPLRLRAVREKSAGSRE